MNPANSLLLLFVAAWCAAFLAVVFSCWRVRPLRRGQPVPVCPLTDRAARDVAALVRRVTP